MQTIFYVRSLCSPLLFLNKGWALLLKWTFVSSLFLSSRNCMQVWSKLQCLWKSCHFLLLHSNTLIELIYEKFLIGHLVHHDWNARAEYCCVLNKLTFNKTKPKHIKKKSFGFHRHFSLIKYKYVFHLSLSHPWKVICLKLHVNHIIYRIKNLTSWSISRVYIILKGEIIIFDIRLPFVPFLVPSFLPSVICSLSIRTGGLLSWVKITCAQWRPSSNFDAILCKLVWTCELGSRPCHAFFESNLGPIKNNMAANMAICHIKKNLTALRQYPRVALNNIRDLPEAFKAVGTFL